MITEPRLRFVIFFGIRRISWIRRKAGIRITHPAGLPDYELRIRTDLPSTTQADGLVCGFWLLIAAAPWLLFEAFAAFHHRFVDDRYVPVRFGPVRMLTISGFDLAVQSGCFLFPVVGLQSSRVVIILGLVRLLFLFQL